MELVSTDIKETEAVAKELVSSLEPKPDGALVVGLYGNLGSGKTTFTQFFAEALGVIERLVSPTFVILKKYPIQNGRGFKTFVHIDAYRLDDSNELKALRFAEEVGNPENLIFIEWADKIEDALPEDAMKIYFEYLDDKTRKISYNK